MTMETTSSSRSSGRRGCLPCPRNTGGMNIAKTGPTVIGKAIVEVAGLTRTQITSDIICPNIQQNIMVASTPNRDNTSRKTRMRALHVAGRMFEVSTYEAAPHTTCKGIIRQFDLNDSPSDLERNIFNERKPLALAVKRIKNTGTIIIAFDGLKVTNFVRYDPVLVKCFLYRKQVDICYACGKLGHRADVRPTPEESTCRGCGAVNPDVQHQCTPKCGLRGGPHPTANKTCKERFQIPYLVRRRRWKRVTVEASRNGASPPPHSSEIKNQLQQPPPQEHRERSRSRGRARSRGSSRRRSRSRGSSCSRTRTRSHSRGRSGSRCRGNQVRFKSCSRSCSRDRRPECQVTWADRVRGKPKKLKCGSPPEHDRGNNRLAQLERKKKTR